jgi:mono/diheme cytochrome c family protein
VRASAFLLVVAVLALSGCGTNSRGGGPLPGTGELLFVRDCGDCHTLADAGTKGTAGTNLDTTKPTMQQVLDAIADGPKVMPPDIVTGADAEAVAAFVAHAVRH